MTAKVVLKSFLLLQLCLHLIECYVDLEHSIQTCHSIDNRPAFCVDQSLCDRIPKPFISEPLENCTDPQKVCCPINDGEEYRDALVIPSGLAWDWTQAWPAFPWATPVRPQMPSVPGQPTTSRPTPIAVNINVTSSPATPSGQIPNANNPPVNQGCGVRNNVNTKDDSELGFIVGGEVSKPNSWPWTVAMYSGGRFVCGASIIGTRHILCAGHCVKHGKTVSNPDQIKLLVGAHHRSKSGEYYGVKRIIVHKYYDETRMQNDISLFELDRPITFSKTQSPVCLPKDCGVCPDSNKAMAILAGWGTTSSGGRVSEELREVAVPIISLRDCQKAYNAEMVTSKQMCAGMLGQGGKDSCQGDSGGPMVMRPVAKDNKHWLCGVVSWGKGCADPKYPGVYTKVCEHLDWINENMNKKIA